MRTPITGAHRAAAAEHRDTDSRSAPVQLTAGRTPTGAPAAAPWAILLALAVLALGVVGIRDAPRHSGRGARFVLDPGHRERHRRLDAANVDSPPGLCSPCSAWGGCLLP